MRQSLGNDNVVLLASRAAIGLASQGQGRARDRAWRSELGSAASPDARGSAGIAAAGGFRVEPLTGGVSSDIVRIALADGRRSAPSGRCASSRWRPTGRRRWSATTTRSPGCGGRVRSCRGAAPAVLGEDRGARHRAARIPAGRRLPAVEGRTARRAAPIRPCRSRSPRRWGASMRRRSTIPRSPRSSRPIACSTRCGSIPISASPPARHPDLAPSTSSACSSDTAATKLGAGAWRRQPQEHPRQQGRRPSGAARCRMRLVRRSGVRRRLLHQSSAAQGPCTCRPSATVLLGQARGFRTRPGSRIFPARCGGDLERAAATLLPCLMLARVDGKSPVEYLRRTSQQSACATSPWPLIAEPVDARIARASIDEDLVA